MKKVLSIIVIIFVITLALMINPLKAGTTRPAPREFGTYADAVEMIRETMRSYYIRGPKIQYNYSKTVYPIGSPEEATEQDTNYSVCAAYTYSVYAEAFGMLYKEGISEFPRYNYNITEIAANEYEKNQDLNGNFLIYYHNKSENKKYLYGDQNTTSNSDDFDVIVNQVKPGDLFVYSGHALIAYGVETNPKTGKKDVLILNSTQDEYIPTRIDGTSKLTHNIFESSNKSDGILEKIPEGTVQFFWLSNSSNFMNKSTGKFDCQKEECAIVRIFYDNNGKAAFNYNINESQYNKGKLRTEYPGLLIEKIVSTGDNNSVYLNDTLTYTIKVTNRSTIQPNKGKTYTNPFYISENISNLVTYQSSNNSGAHNNGKVTWKINSLEKGETITLTYTVKVNDNTANISKIITSTGTFYSEEKPSVTLSTGTVKNKIIPKINNLNQDYKTCYKKYESTKTGLELINETYKCSTGNDFKFTEIDFSDMFTKTLGTTPKSQSKILKNTNATTTSKQFNNMILNDYFNGLVIGDGKYYLPRMSGSPRAKTINSSDFKNGDLLIYSINNSKYTKESGVYAYIYLDGKFVGKNYSGTNKRNEFVYSYYADITNNLYEGNSKLTANNKEEILTYANYQTLFDKDYYVILRPEQVIKEPYKIAVTKKPTKINYVVESEILDLSGIELTITNNDGSTFKLYSDSSDITVENFDNSSLGTNTLKVKYKNLETTFAVNIIPRAITSISIETYPTKLNYRQNIDSLNLTGGKLKLNYNDGKSLTIDMKNATATGFDNTKPGKNKITLTYNDKTISFEVEILPKELEKIEISQAPVKNKYIKNKETLDLTGGKIKLIYNDSSTSELLMTDSNIKVSGFSNTKTGKKTITVTYEKFTTSFEIEIIDGKSNQIRIYASPRKTTYILNQEKLDLTDGRIEVIYNNDIEIIDLTNEEVKVESFDNTSVGKNTLTITYKNLKTTMDVEIISKEIKELKINTLPKYKGKVIKKSDMDISVGNIKVIYTDETSDIIKMTDRNINIINIDNNTPGISKVKLTYLNKDLIFDLTYEVEESENNNTPGNNTTPGNNNTSENNTNTGTNNNPPENNTNQENDNNDNNNEENNNETNNENNKKEEKKSNINNLIIYIIIGTGVVLLGVGTAIYFLKFKNTKIKDNI